VILTVLHNWQVVQKNIDQACRNSSRSPEEINVIAVTKYVDLQRMEEALNTGLEHLGESKAQDASTKWEKLGHRGIWHFIGHLQSNKAKDIIGKFTYIHSLDRLSLANEIEKRAKDLDVIIPCFIQVNVSGEETKHGLSPDKVEEFIRQTARFSHIMMVGLMTMAPFSEDPEETRPVFRRLKEIQLELQAMALTHAPLTELSMGMSNDYQVAIEEGATFIRLGTTLVGSS
jgi:pyridoxal phosphate enzyme (YggS family)